MVFGFPHLQIYNPLPTLAFRTIVIVVMINAFCTNEL